jgi:MFS family permease
MATDSKIIGPTILSVALLTVMAGAAISPAIANIAKAFPIASPGLIKLVLTLPPLVVIPFALISGRLCDFFGKRTVLITGLILYLIGGLGGGFAGTIEVLLGCRALLGLSVGLIMPISTAIVSDFFDGEKAMQMMGWISASNHFGGMAAQMISGIVATLCWRYAFGAYAMGFVAIGMVFFYLPEPAKKIQAIGTAQKKLPIIIYLYVFAMFALMLVFYTIPVNLSFFIEENGMGNAASSGAAFAMMTGSAFLIGIYFRQIKVALKQFAIVAAISAMAAGLGTLYLANGIIPVFFGVGLIGLGEGFLLPLIFHSVRTSVDLSQSVSAMAIVSSMMFLGQFFSPIIIDSICKQWVPVSQGSGSPFVVACCMSITGIILAVLQIIVINNNKHHVKPKEI